MQHRFSYVSSVFFFLQYIVQEIQEIIIMKLHVLIQPVAMCVLLFAVNFIHAAQENERAIAPGSILKDSIETTKINRLENAHENLPDLAWTRSDGGEPTKDFPCPAPQGIFPCVCSYNGSEITIGCYGNINETTLENVFKSSFPLTELYRLNIFDNDELVYLGDILQDLTFVEVAVERCHNLEEVSQFWLDNSRNTLEYLAITHSSLTTEKFPFISMDSYRQLHTLFMGYSNFTFLPSLYSDTLTEIAFESANITYIGRGITIIITLL